MDANGLSTRSRHEGLWSLALAAMFFLTFAFSAGVARADSPVTWGDMARIEERRERE